MWFFWTLEGSIPPGKTNMFPENQSLEDVFPIEIVLFLGDMLVVGGVILKKHGDIWRGEGWTDGFWGGTHSFMVIYFIFNIGNDWLHSRSKSSYISSPSKKSRSRSVYLPNSLDRRTPPALMVSDTDAGRGGQPFKKHFQRRQKWVTGLFLYFFLHVFIFSWRT